MNAVKRRWRSCTLGEGSKAMEIPGDALSINGHRGAHAPSAMPARQSAAPWHLFRGRSHWRPCPPPPVWRCRGGSPTGGTGCRSEEHTSELQSLTNLVCRLLLEKKKQ